MREHYKRVEEEKAAREKEALTWEEERSQRELALRKLMEGVGLAKDGRRGCEEEKEEQRPIEVQMVEGEEIAPSDGPTFGPIEQDQQEKELRHTNEEQVEEEEEEEETALSSDPTFRILNESEEEANEFHAPYVDGDASEWEGDDDGDEFMGFGEVDTKLEGLVVLDDIEDLDDLGHSTETSTKGVIAKKSKKKSSNNSARGVPRLPAAKLEQMEVLEDMGDPEELGDTKDLTQVNVKKGKAKGKKKPDESKRLLQLQEYAPTVVHNYVVARTPVPTAYRRMARACQEFLPEAGTLSFDFAIQFFVTMPQRGNGLWTTRCHYHTILDQTATINDIDNAYRHEHPELYLGKDGKPVVFKGHLVTGVPFERSSGTFVPPKILKRTPTDKTARVPKVPGGNDLPRSLPEPPNHLTTQEWLEFYLLDEDGNYSLHCGCQLDEVLLDFYDWKSSPPLVSVTTGAKELLGNPPDPRLRMHFNAAQRRKGVKLDRLYKYDFNGKLQDPIEGSFWEGKFSLAPKRKETEDPDSGDSEDLGEKVGHAAGSESGGKEKAAHRTSGNSGKGREIKRRKMGPPKEKSDLRTGKPNRMKAVRKQIMLNAARRGRGPRASKKDTVPA
ncbi:hypothetical protein DFP72DRAFT_1122228 [Ephemerocybe angulata]|uniref:Uncharacterized protein n=1 Tax=Ephemerocybe angulata TaxID=980116 RepID=A0A8H6HZW3_9AGAR|nr:hypothetical protein DFP72DRAFT_1122228 [Tulosesus angulatus]